MRSFSSTPTIAEQTAYAVGAPQDNLVFKYQAQAVTRHRGRSPT